MPSNGNGNGAGGSDTPLHYVAQVIRKLWDGTYPTEATRCFCGCEPNDEVLTAVDRYTIPHRMVMCNECCLIRANPRMTKEAYREFYNTEYLPIYDGFEDKNRSTDELFENQAKKGSEIIQFLKANECEFEMKSVLDFGGGRGGSLIPFQEKGCKVLNVDWNAADREYAIAHGLPSVATLEETDFKADLILMQDVIEHLPDLTYLNEIRKHLSHEGRLFLYTPGLFAAAQSKVFQNAHTYQFIADTLEYVMLSQGFVAEFLDEQIVSVWNPSYYAEPYAVKPAKWRQYIFEHLTQKEKRAVPPIRTRSKFSQRLMLNNLEANLPRKLPELTELRGKFSGRAAIIGGGPSINGQMDKVKELQQAGATIFSIDRMYPWCMKNQIKPDFVVLLDSSDDVVEGFSDICPDATHLIVANGLPKIFDLLKDHKVYFVAGGINAYPEARDIWAKHGYRKLTIVTTGGSVVLSSMYLAIVLGFKNVDLFGFDCMVPLEGSAYAAGIAGQGVDRKYYELEVGDETVLTCNSFIAFAQQFFSMVEIARQWKMLDRINVHGESLVTKMWERTKEEENLEWQITPQERPILLTP